MTRSTAPERERIDPAPGGSRFSRLRRRVHAWPGGFVFWRVMITVIGVAVIVVGIVLLPLPGPGWLIIFAGIGILGTEFLWAKRLLAFARAKVRAWTAWVARQHLAVRGLILLGGLAALAAIAYAGYRFL